MGPLRLAQDGKDWGDGAVSCTRLSKSKGTMGLWVHGGVRFSLRRGTMWRTGRRQSREVCGSMIPITGYSSGRPRLECVCVCVCVCTRLYVCIVGAHIQYILNIKLTHTGAGRGAWSRSVCAGVLHTCEASVDTINFRRP